MVLVLVLLGSIEHGMTTLANFDGIIIVITIIVTNMTNIITRYYDHIINTNISDNSIIIMIDAYDVMLFPRIKIIGRVSSSS